jgi:hypothetical protein
MAFSFLYANSSKDTSSFYSFEYQLRWHHKANWTVTRKASQLRFMRPRQAREAFEEKRKKCLAHQLGAVRLKLGRHAASTHRSGPGINFDGSTRAIPVLTPSCHIPSSIEAEDHQGRGTSALL